MVILTKNNFENEISNFDGAAVIDLYADWCAPCKMLAPIVEELAGELTDIKFCKVNVDSEPELAAMFKVSSIPMIAIVKNNTFVDFHVGYIPKDELRDFITSNCE